MSDFTFEQLKSLFDSLADRIDKTAGDKLSHDELSAIRDILEKQASHLKKLSSQKSESLDTKQFLNDFWSSWRSQQPFKPLTDEQRRQQAAQRPQAGPRQQNNGGDDDEGQSFIRRKQQEAEATEGVTDSLRRTAREAKSNSKAQSNALGSILGKIGGFATKLGSITENLGKGTMTGIAGGVTDKIIGSVEDRTDAYRTMIQTAEGSFRSIQEMTNTVNSNNMSVQELAKAMEQSQGARMLGGRDYANLTGALTKQTQAMANMGLNFEQRQEAMQDYLEVQMRQGNLNRLSQQDMISGIQSMVKSSQETAHILVTTAKEERERAAKLAQNHLRNAAVRNSGMDMQQVNRATGALDKFGEGASQMLEEMIASKNGQIMTSESATYAAANPEVMKMAQDLYAQLRQRQEINPEALAQVGQSVADGLRKSGVTDQLTTLGYTGQMSPEMMAAIQGRVEGADAQFNTDPMAPKLDDAGTRALLDTEEVTRAAAATLRTAFDTVSNSILNTQGLHLEQLATGAIDASNAMSKWIASFQGAPDVESKIATVAEVLMGVAAAGVILSKVFALKNWMGGLLGRGNNAANAARGGRGAGAGAGPGAGPGNRRTPTPANDNPGGRGGQPGGAGRGGSFISRTLRGAAGAAEGASGGAIAGGLGKALGKNALIGGAFEGLGYLTGDKEMSWKNLSKSGLRVGGGAIGGLFGGGLASIATGAAGYYAGDKLGDWLLGPDDTKQAPQKPATPQQPQRATMPRDPATMSVVNQQQRLQQQSNTGNQQRAQAISPVAQNQRKPGQADATGARPRTSLTPEQMNQRIMDASEKASAYLKSLKENSDKQLDMMREEIALTRVGHERTHRLLEEGNRNTRAIADHSA